MLEVTTNEVRVNSRAVFSVSDNADVSLVQLERLIQQVIRSRYPDQVREKIQRTGEGKAELDSFFESMGMTKDQAVALVMLKRQAMAYERAKSRLARYRLAEGLIGGWVDIEGEVIVGSFVRLPGGDVGNVMLLYRTDEGEAVADVALAGDLSVGAQLVAGLQLVQWVEPVEPLPATVEVAVEDGTIISEPNPLIVQDDAERTAAQAVVDGVSQAVIDLVEVRANA